MVIYPKDMLFHGVLRQALVPRELEKHLGTEGAGPRYFSSLHLSADAFLDSWGRRHTPQPSIHLSLNIGHT